MSQDSKQHSIAENLRNSEAEAALEQMYGYFSREDRSRRIVSEFDAYRTASKAA